MILLVNIEWSVKRSAIEMVRLSYILRRATGRVKMAGYAVAGMAKKELHSI